MGGGLTQVILESVRLARGDRVLVHGLSEVVSGGDIVEVTGPNGSGKTTLLRAIAGFVQPAEGRIRFVHGKGEPLDPESLLHVTAHRDGLKGPLSARAHVRYWAGLLGRGGGDVDAVLERVGLARLADSPTRIFSQGQSRRLALARLLIAPRPIWLLDEPAAGLDRAGKQFLADAVTSHAASGGLVLAAVHEPLGVSARTLVMGSV